MTNPITADDALWMALAKGWYETEHGHPRYPHLERLTPTMAAMIEADDRLGRLPFEQSIPEAYRRALAASRILN